MLCGIRCADWSMEQYPAQWYVNYRPFSKVVPYEKMKGG